MRADPPPTLECDTERIPSYLHHIASRDREGSLDETGGEVGRKLDKEKTKDGEETLINTTGNQTLRGTPIKTDRGPHRLGLPWGYSVRRTVHNAGT